MQETIEGETCPACLKKTLTLREQEEDIPFFGKTFIFSMNCESCDFEKSDIEAETAKKPMKTTFTIESPEDLKVRVIKSSQATIKIPQMRMSVTPGAASQGYVSNIEGILNRFEKVIEEQRDKTDDKTVRKRAKNLLKKMRNVRSGEERLKIIIEDKSGNSAIISEKAVQGKK